MVPKTSSSSGSKAGGSAASSSNSSDLYNKMNDYVLSKTPDQSATSQFLHQVMRIAVASISQEIGWNTAHLSALDVLSDLAVRYLLQVAKQSKKYTEHYGRTLVNEDDVALGFRDMNISISELEEYIQNFDPVVIPKEIPYIPVPRKTDLNILRPGSQEVLTRPVHVHEYMPPMIFEQPEEESETEKEILITDVPVVSEEVLIKSESTEEIGLTNGTDPVQNGIMPLVLEEPSQVPEVAAELVVTELPPVVITEEVEIKTEDTPENEAVIMPEEAKSVLHQVSIVQNDLEESSDDDIEPAASKAASIFATFKSTKKLESASENAALKRVRKMLEEQGHPVREVTSVIMTSSGYLSESREGRLPESKPPSIRSFFDPPPAPLPKELKKTTMKKILQGVKKGDKGHTDSEEENVEGPGLFGVLDKIVGAGGSGPGGPNEGVDVAGENGVLADVNKDIQKKKLSKQERKLLQKQKKEMKARKKLKMKSKEKLLLKAKSVQAAAACKELEASTSASGIKSKLTIFNKIKSSKLDPSGSSPMKKKKKDKKNKLKLKELKRPLAHVEEDTALMKAPAAPVGTELIESDEDFSNADAAGGVVSPVHIRNPAALAHVAEEQKIPMILKKKFKKEKESAISSGNTVKMKPPVLQLSQHPGLNKKIIKQEKPLPGTSISPQAHPPIPKTKISKLVKRPLMRQEGDGEPPMKKKRGRPKKIWGDGSANMAAGVPPAGGSIPLQSAQLATIGKSLMIKEPSLKLNKNTPTEPPFMKIRREHMEIQDLVPNVASTLITKPPTISPNKSGMGPSSALSSAELLKRLPAQPGLIPDRISPVPPVRIPKDLPSSISITPAALSSPQKEVVGPSTSRGFPGALPPNVCSSVTITRINMSHQQKLPSPYDDSITPGIGPPPGLEGPHKRKLKGVPPPPPLQIPIQAETESGITITPIMMGGGGGGSNKEHRYDHPLPPPPPLQERPAPKHSMLAKLDEELSSTPPAPPSSSASTSSKDKEQRRKEKEKRKELKKEKKKKAKDKDKSEKKKKKKDKSGDSTTSGGDVVDTPPPAVPKLTLKLGGQSNTPTPVDSPNPPQVYHEPALPAPPPLKRLSFKLQEEPKPPKQKVVPAPIPEEEDLEVARFAPLVTRPQKPARAAKAHAAAAVAAVAMGSQNHQEIVQFPSTPKDSSKLDSKRGRGRPPKGAVAGPPAPPTPSNSKSTKSSLTVLETETVGCIIDDQGNKIWICPACGRQDDGSPMIGCDICDDWYHFACMGIEQEPSEEEQWYCPRCVRKQQKPDGKSKKRK